MDKRGKTTKLSATQELRDKSLRGTNSDEAIQIKKEKNGKI